MKNPTQILTGVALFAVALSTSYGQSATTSPVGYRTETLLPGFNLVGANLAEKVEAAGTIDAVAGNVITDNDVDFTALAGMDLLLKLTDGANNGTLLQVDQSGQHTLTAVSGGNAAAVGGKYELRVSSSIAKLFGATNSAGLTAGGDVTSADNIYIPLAGGGFTIVYYSNGTGFDPVGWFDTNSTAAGNLEIPYSLGFFIRNSTATNKDIVFVGHVITSVTKFTAVQNFNYVSRILPVPMSLDASLLKDQLAQGSDLTSADNVYIPAGAAGYKIAYFSDGTGFDPVGWIADGAPAGTTNLQSAMLIFRRSATPVAVNLIIPAGLDL
jgi:hypothetical protein